MKTLPAIQGEGLPAREIVDKILRSVARIDNPETMARVELREVPRPTRREVELLLKRELNGQVWSLDCFTRGELLGPKHEAQPLDADVTDVRTLFGEFVDERSAQGAYDERFAGAFRERGLHALNGAIERVSQALAEEDR
jgi:hypothetical protein